MATWPRQQLTSLLGVLASTVEAAKTITPATSSSHSDLSAALVYCSRALLDLETFLIPGYVQPTSGIQYSLDQCSDMASMLAQLSTIHINLLGQHILASLGLLGYSGFGNSSNGNSVRITDILRRSLLIMHFILRHLPMNATLGRREYMQLLHNSGFFNTCFGILSGCTNRLQMLSATHPAYLSDHEDRRKILLCGAVLGCTLCDFCHAVYGDVRASSEVIEEFGGHNDPRPSKNAIWTSLLAPACREILPGLTTLLTTEAPSRAFYQQQSPLYKKLLTPCLGLHSLVSSTIEGILH